MMQAAREDGEAEKNEIEQTVKFKIALTNYYILKKMIVIGLMTNSIAGSFIIWVLFQQISHVKLFTWYAILIAFSILNVAWSASFWFRCSPFARGSDHFSLHRVGRTWKCDWIAGR